MDVFLAHGRYDCAASHAQDARRVLSSLTFDHWQESVGDRHALLADEFAGPTALRDREVWAATTATTEVYCQADDDCLLRPIAYKRRFADATETWDQHVERVFREQPTLGMAAALTTPPWDAQEVYVQEGQSGEVWVPPWFQHGTYQPFLDAKGQDLWTRRPAVGGVRFLRKGLLTPENLPPVENPARYDYELAKVIREQGYLVGYLILLPCHHLGHCWSTVGRDSSYAPGGQAI